MISTTLLTNINNVFGDINRDDIEIYNNNYELKEKVDVKESDNIFNKVTTPLILSSFALCLVAIYFLVDSSKNEIGDSKHLTELSRQHPLTTISYIKPNRVEHDGHSKETDLLTQLPLAEAEAQSNLIGLEEPTKVICYNINNKNTEEEINDEDKLIKETTSGLLIAPEQVNNQRATKLLEHLTIDIDNEIFFKKRVEPNHSNKYSFLKNHSLLQLIIGVGVATALGGYAIYRYFNNASENIITPSIVDIDNISGSHNPKIKKNLIPNFIAQTQKSINGTNEYGYYIFDSSKENIRFEKAGINEDCYQTKPGEYIIFTFSETESFNIEEYNKFAKYVKDKSFTKDFFDNDKMDRGNSTNIILLNQNWISYKVNVNILFYYNYILHHDKCLIGKGEENVTKIIGSNNFDDYYDPFFVELTMGKSEISKYYATNLDELNSSLIDDNKLANILQVINEDYNILKVNYDHDSSINEEEIKLLNNNLEKREGLNNYQLVTTLDNAASEKSSLITLKNKYIENLEPILANLEDYSHKDKVFLSYYLIPNEIDLEKENIKIIEKEVLKHKEDAANLRKNHGDEIKSLRKKHEKDEKIRFEKNDPETKSKIGVINDNYSSEKDIYKKASSKKEKEITELNNKLKEIEELNYNEKIEELYFSELEENLTQAANKKNNLITLVTNYLEKLKNLKTDYDEYLSTKGKVSTINEEINELELYRDKLKKEVDDHDQENQELWDNHRQEIIEERAIDEENDNSETQRQIDTIDDNYIYEKEEYEQDSYNEEKAIKELNNKLNEIEGMNSLDLEENLTQAANKKNTLIRLINNYLVELKKLKTDYDEYLSTKGKVSTINEEINELELYRDKLKKEVDDHEKRSMYLLKNHEPEINRLKKQKQQESDRIEKKKQKQQENDKIKKLNKKDWDNLYGHMSKI